MEATKPSQRVTRREMSWDEIDQQGTYVEVGSGDLYRIPKEALIVGSSPVIQKVSNGTSRFIQLSEDPLITLHEAQNRSANQNVKPNF